MAIISETFSSMTSPPIGTLAHEWILFHGAVAGYEKANATAIHNE